MELRTNQGHVKLYFWCLEVWGAFRGGYPHRLRHGSDLCQYIRTIFVWMPLALIVNVGVWLYALYVLIYVPLTYFGMVGSVAGYLTVALASSAVFFFFYAKRKLADKRAVDNASSDVCFLEEEEKAPGFIKIIWLYLVAMKQRVCPIIEFKAVRTREDV